MAQIGTQGSGLQGQTQAVPSETARKSNRGRMLGPYSSREVLQRGRAGEKSVKSVNVSCYYNKKSASAVPADRGRGI